MDPFKTDHKILGPSFEGVAIEVPVVSSDAFFLENRERFTRAGEDAFLRSLKIPASFYREQASSTQADLLVAQKSNVRRRAGSPDGLYVLADPNGKIIFASPKTSVGWKEPAEVLGLGPDWIPRPSRSGFLRYVNYAGSAPKEKDDYFASLFLTVPIFYSNFTTMEVGLYRLKCQNGAIDTVQTLPYRLTASDSSPQNVRILTQAFTQVVHSPDFEYNAFLEYLRKVPADADAVRKHLTELVSAPIMPFPKTVVQKVFRHLDLISAGKEPEEEGAPFQQNTMWDFLDSMTWFTKELPSVSSQRKSETGIFNHFFDMYNASLGRDRLKLKRHEIEVTITKGGSSTAESLETPAESSLLDPSLN